MLFTSCSPSLLAEYPTSEPSVDYVKIYTDFLHEYAINGDSDFVAYGYYLLDMNFDGVPELSILHHSGGTMGGYYKYYCINEGKVEAILDKDGQPATTSSYTRVLADYTNKKVYLLKEMYLLKGNENGTYGYVREVVNRNGIPYINDILSLEVNQESDLDKYSEIDYLYEDEYLSDAELDACLITRYYEGKEWEEITSDEYLRQKRALIPVNNDLIDLHDTGACIIFPLSPEGSLKENEYDRKIYISDTGVDFLFSNWREYTAKDMMVLSEETIVFNVLQSFEDVLLNKALFFDTYVNAYVSLDEYLVREDDGIRLAVDLFSVVDMDGNGIPEMVLRWEQAVMANI